MKAAVLAVGTELLGTDRLDTNSLAIAAVLERFGVRLVRKCVVGDDEDEIAGALQSLATKADLVIVTGGLGPTRDDLTRQAVARLVGADLQLSEEVLERIAVLYARFGREMPAANRRQALVVDGSEVLDNPIGTAPGLRIEHEGTEIFLFPGVPRELEAMLSSTLEPWLATRAGAVRRGRVELRTASVPESAVEDLLAPAYEALGREGIAVLARPGEVRVRLEAEGVPGELEQELERRRALVAGLLGDCVYADDGRELEEVVIEALRAAGSTVAVAESCTGGLIGARLTSVPGSSDVFLGGGIVYSNRLKHALVGVPESVIERFGAVSEESARAMARGARDRFGADLAVAVTGIAGPGGGTPSKPVGLVHLALAHGSGRAAGEDHLQVRFPGDRQRVREQTSQLALEMLRRRLLGLGVETFWRFAKPARADLEAGVES